MENSLKKFTVELVADVSKKETTLDKLNEKTIESRQALVAWLQAIDPMVKVVPKESSRLYTPIFFIESASETIEQFLNDESTRPAFISSVSSTEILKFEAFGGDVDLNDGRPTDTVAQA